MYRLNVAGGALCGDPPAVLTLYYRSARGWCIRCGQVADHCVRGTSAVLRLPWPPHNTTPLFAAQTNMNIAIVL